MKTAVSLPDDLFRKTDRLAKQLKLSRSGLIATALRQFMARRDEDAITEQMNRVCAEVDTRPDPWLRRAAVRTLTRESWDAGDASR